jgi:hypothetical protein
MCRTCGKYTDQSYAGSICETSTASCARSEEGLRRRLIVSEGAVMHHSNEGNECQVVFFSDAVNHINKLLKPFNKKHVS